MIVAKVTTEDESDRVAAPRTTARLPYNNKAKDTFASAEPNGEIGWLQRDDGLLTGMVWYHTYHTI